MKIKSNRALSFIIVTLAYVIALVISVVVFIYLPTDLWLKILVADVVATVVIFVFSVALKNASVYDPYWSVQPIVILGGMAFVFGFSVASILIFIAVCIWGVRLTANWAYTFKSLEHQDWRYTMLKEKTGVFYPIINFVGIHMVPTLIVYMCTMPVVFVFQYASSINAFSIICFVCVLLSVLLQGVSDFQMHSFRRNRRGKFIRTGAWKYSRHPNYLAEILTWWSVGFYAFSLMYTCWFLLVGAFMNTLLFLFVSIPMADKRQSAKEGFDVYKKQTRMLLPLPKFIKK
ncbi:MAG: DUF1295 domain-containing protein [Clostridiales bacterium]|nr:DUF1295 domain-containing protein [Clostridiales bacterium]